MKSNMRGKNRSVIMNSSDSSIYYRNNKNRRNNVNEKGRCEGRLPNTLTHSLTSLHLSPLTIIIILHHIYNLDNHNFDDDH